MLKVTYENNEQWLNARRGKIGGSRLKDIIVKRGTGYKIGFYELIAEKLSITEDDFDGYIPNETPMARGTRLQKMAIDRFSKEMGVKVDESLVIWSREDNPDICVSPDGSISDTEAIETKCLSSARHIEAFLTQQVPDEYQMQAIQYFIVNDKLEKLYFTFYDPRIPAKDFFFIVVKREDILEDIVAYRIYQEKILKEVDEVVNKLSVI